MLCHQEPEEQERQGGVSEDHPPKEIDLRGGGFRASLDDLEPNMEHLELGRKS